MRHAFATICLILSVPTWVLASEREIDEIVIELDRTFFDQGFNQCDLTKIERLLGDDFEFVHDKDGISNKTEFIASMKSGLCGSRDSYRATRELVLATHQVYALHRDGELYGAVQQGEHEFSEHVAGGNAKHVGNARFTNLWLKSPDGWRLAKSISFDHQAKSETDKSLPNFSDRNEVEIWLQALGVPTLGLGIIEEGKLQHIDVYGHLKDDVAAPYNTIFNVASLTKPVIAVLALKLVSQGRWDLDLPLHQYWTDPDLQNDPRHKRLTTRLVLSHQTGLPNWRYNNKQNKLSFEFDPGAGYQYSGEGFEYLRRALEARFNKSLQQLTNELIFEPMTMVDSSLVWNDSIDESRYATNYAADGKQYKTVQRESANGADDLLTTIGDYGRFLTHVLRGDGLSDQVFDALSKPHVVTKRGKHFALGFERYELGGNDYALSHGGADNGVQAIVFLLPKSKSGLLIFTNVDDGYKVYEPLMTYYLGSIGEKIFEIETDQ